MPLVVAGFSLAHKDAKKTDNNTRVPWVSAPQKSPNKSLVWDKSATIENHIKSVYGGYQYTDAHTRLKTGKFDVVNCTYTLVYGGLQWLDAVNRTAFSDFALQHNISKRIVYNSRLPFIDKQSRGVNGSFNQYDVLTRSAWGLPPKQDQQIRIAWDSSYTAKREVSIDTNPYVPVPEITDIPTNQIQQVYFIMHSLSVNVLPSNTAIDVGSISLSIDIDAFAWTMNMQVLDGIELIRPDVNGNKEVQINIDGYIWIFIVESYTENKKFADNSWTVTGRSKTAYLSAPYKLPISNTYTSLINAAQIVDNELLNSGFTATYSTVDWAVNADAFSYQNLTAMQAIRRVADAIGGVILPHQSADSLIINPRYQASPWDWGTATPKAIITHDVITGMSGNWQPKPDINGVYVGGNTVGVECFVKRTGTAGDQLAAQHVENLITHQDAGREKGRNILSDRGKQEVVSIELPILPIGQTPEIYQCGDLLEIQETSTWRAMVLSININASVNNGAITAEQTVSLEKHYGEY